MWVYVLRRVLYGVPVYLGIVLLLMLALRINDPVWGFLGKNASESDYLARQAAMGLDRPFLAQYASFLGQIVTLDLGVESWAHPGYTVGQTIADALVPSLSITAPALLLSVVLSLCVATIAAHYRGRPVDRALMILAVLGMSVSYLVYIILGQYLGAYLLSERLGLDLFAVQGYEPGIGGWARYCLLPVLISAIVALGYDARFYRAVLVAESGREHVFTALAKGLPRRRVLVHVLKNAMVPIVTRVMITLPFLVMGSLLVEVYFNIPGIGRALYEAILANDFPVTQGLVATFAGLFLFTVLLNDVLCALLDPRLRLP